MWQRSQGTKDDNYYPYHKHLPDCEICQAADHIDKLELLQKMKPLPIADCGGCNDLEEQLAACRRELDRCRG